MPPLVFPQNSFGQRSIAPKTTTPIFFVFVNLSCLFPTAVCHVLVRSWKDDVM